MEAIITDKYGRIAKIGDRLIVSQRLRDRSMAPEDAIFVLRDYWDKGVYKYVELECRYEGSDGLPVCFGVDVRDTYFRLYVAIDITHCYDPKPNTPVENKVIPYPKWMKVWDDDGVMKVERYVLSNHNGLYQCLFDELPKDLSKDTRLIQYRNAKDINPRISDIKAEIQQLQAELDSLENI
jgi:hypothetical protein